MIKITDIAWLGGLMEGEGSFYLRSGKYPNISVGMTAEDTITKVANMWDTGISHRGNMWKAELNGIRAIMWMMTLFPFLGRNRKNTIVEIVRFWREYVYEKAYKGLNIPAVCHPDKQAVGSDANLSDLLCIVCYKRQLRYKERLLRKVG